MAKPAPASSASAIANSPTTRIRRTLLCDPPVPVRPPSLSASPGSTRDAYHAGAQPNSNPDNMVAAKVTARTGRSSLQAGLGRQGPLRHDSHQPAQQNNPQTAAQHPSDDARRLLSVRNWAKILSRVPPMEPRTAISLCRAVPLANKRLATLTQAMRRTKPTAPNSSQRVLNTVIIEKIVLEAIDPCAPSTIAFGVGGSDAGSDRIHICLRLVQADAGFQAAHGNHPVIIVVDLFGTKGQRRGNFGVIAI